MFDGEVIRNKGDLFYVDVAITGIDAGTADNPKFQLWRVLKECIFREVEDLVGPGGKYAGYKVIFQGDNAGPHREERFLRAVKEYCREKGWHWEPQAPQMPHANVLDLSVFPALSRRHCEKARSNNGMRMLQSNEIWDTAQKVWDDLPSAKIASGFVQAYQICQKVIQQKGSNKFLTGSDGGMHVGIRKNFKETDYGLARNDGKKINAPPAVVNETDM